MNMPEKKSTIVEDGFGFVPRPNMKRGNQQSAIVRRYTMTNKNGARVQLISWGAGIQSIKVPNKSGILDDVVLGFDDLDGYLKNRYMGSIIGPVTNCVSKDSMYINPAISPPVFHRNWPNSDNYSNSRDFDNVNWESHIVKEQVVMSRISESISETCRSMMLTQVKYSWTDENELQINIRATVTKKAPVDITNHCFFNLAGHGAGSTELSKHVASINADSLVISTGSTCLPSGGIQPLKGTALDMRLPTQLTKRKFSRIPGGGYNHDLCITSPSCWCYRFHARILHPKSGRILEIYSNQPSLRFYTGNYLPDPTRVYPPDLEDYSPCDASIEMERTDLGKFYQDNRNRVNEIIGKGGVPYKRHSGFVLSPQNYPNTFHLKDFPSCMLYPGKIYVHDLSYKFSVLSET